MAGRSVGDRISHYRLSKGLSRAKLAEKAGLSSVAIWKIETGVNSPTAETMQRIAAALEIPAALFLT